VTDSGLLGSIGDSATHEIHSINKGNTMSKTEHLIQSIENGKHRILDNGFAYRRTISGDWLRETKYRRDVIARAYIRIRLSRSEHNE
jgi:hypothetical protein